MSRIFPRTPMNKLHLSSSSFTRRLFALITSFLLVAAAHAQVNTLAEYVLGSGDVLRITVYQNPDLTLETRVSEAGTISYPLLGSVKVGGLSVQAAGVHDSELARVASDHLPVWARLSW